MEITHTYCDKCNLKQDRTKMFKIPPEWCSILGLEQDIIGQGAFALRGIFTGTYAEAEKYDGWKQADYGHICPLCIFEEAQLEEGGETTVMDPMEALALVKGA